MFLKLHRNVAGTRHRSLQYPLEVVSNACHRGNSVPGSEVPADACRLVREYNDRETHHGAFLCTPHITTQLVSVMSPPPQVRKMEPGIHCGRTPHWQAGCTTRESTDDGGSTSRNAHPLYSPAHIMSKIAAPRWKPPENTSRPLWESTCAIHQHFRSRGSSQ